MKPNVLVADDEEGIRFTFDRFLSNGGYQVTSAKNFEEALGHITNGSDFDVIFVDIILDGGSGIDILKEIRDKGIKSPVIMITGYPNIETASEAVRLGAFDYIPKPVQKETLMHVTSMALQYKKLNDEKEKYRANIEAIYRNIKDAIVMVDSGLSVLEVNDAASNICGLNRKDIGKHFGFIEKHCNGKCLEAVSAAISKKAPVEVYRLECHPKDNARQVVSVATSPLLNTQGIPYGAIMVVRDDTRISNLEIDLKERQQFHNLIGKSEKMQEVYSLIEMLADTHTTVLITGESGTGKELVAEALHYRSNRSSGPLVKVNCSALAENLLESELFGHVRGAFTGAIKDKIGRFEKANGGTIFLDEIGDISPRIQVGLLRVLQEKEFERVGDSTMVKIDVRVVTATNQDLYKKVRAGVFREDLYYRLHVINLNIPSLGERREDIPLLVEHFINKFNRGFNKDIKGVSDDVQKIFMEYPWPGNVRELEHALEHAFILCRQPVITIDHLPKEFKLFVKGKEDLPAEEESTEIEKIRQVLKKTSGNKAEAARLLGVSRRTLYRKIEDYKITMEEK
ncbi:MAG: sigma 54-interacting transcriptional regulator [Nitrospirae bacterium]|nr:sigma 54-interacting transcriptional regulator [Nitrospirota bacterium]